MENPFAVAPPGLLAACLIVEDDSLIRLDLEETLRDFGVGCVYGAATLEGAMQIVESAEIRFAVLDFELVHAIRRGWPNCWWDAAFHPCSSPHMVPVSSFPRG